MHIFDTETAPTYNLYFQDNGIGIDHKFFDKIFLMFNRLHRHDDYEGTGLGLYTCKKIVTEFNGELNLESKQDDIEWEIIANKKAADLTISFTFSVSKFFHLYNTANGRFNTMNILLII